MINLTANTDNDVKIRCIRTGAKDFLVKRADDIELQSCVGNLLKFRRHAETGKLNEMPEQSKAMPEGECRELEAPRQDRFDFQNIVTNSPVMKKALKLAALVAAFPRTTVIINGESGSGKEDLSRAIHFASAGMSGEFVVVNCAAIPETLLESELFDQARGGTLLLDRIGDMPLGLQAQLPRLLERRNFEKVGSNETIPVNCRVIATTNRDLPDMIAAGRFREDLFHCLNVYPITIPPLRERRDDITLLVDHFLNTFRQHQRKPLPGVSQKALAELLAYQWPGNIRELRNCLERAAIVCDGLIQPEHLIICNTRVSGSGETNRETDLPAGGAITYNFAFNPDMVSMEAVTRQVLDITLDWCRGNKSRAASLLGVSRNKFYR